jgi:hypothetical protein
MKLIFGIIPCLNRIWLERAFPLITSGIEEIVALACEEDTVLSIKTDIYSGVKTLELIYHDDGNEEAKALSDQEKTIMKFIKDPAKDFVGFLITQVLKTSFHGFQIYLLPQYRDLDHLNQVQEHFEKTARLWNAPYASLCTNLDQAALRAGYTKTYSTFRKKM